jgi:hypothetical protein
MQIKYTWYDILQVKWVFFLPGGKKESDKLPAPTTVLESLRHTLSEYKRRLETTSDEVSNGLAPLQQF